jgi:dipeptidyl aminopeptidase/acylaminoacyl peptidase
MIRKHLSGVLVTFLFVTAVAQAKEIRRFGGSQQEVNALTFSPDGKTVASSGSDRVLHLWDIVTGKELRTISGEGIQPWSLAFSPDGKWLADVCADMSIGLWEAASGKTLHTMKGHQAIPWSVAFSPTGKVLASGSEDGTVRLWDPATGKEVRRLGVPQDGVWPVAFSPNGKTLAVGYGGGAIRLWDVGTGKEVRRLDAHGGGVWPLVFSPDGKTLASSTWQGTTIRLWNVATGKVRRHIEVSPGIGWNLSFSPDGRTLASGGTDRIVYLWEVATGKERARFAGHKAKVQALTFAPDGKAVASSGADGTIILWDVPELPAKVILAEKDLESLWRDLHGPDGIKAYRAIWKLTTSPSLTVPFLQPRLRPKPVALPDLKRLARLIGDLDHRKFAVRRRAALELEKLGRLAEQALRQALRKAQSLEVRMRLTKLLAKIEKLGLSAEQLQALRGLEVLEKLGTSQARKVLVALARQHTDPWLRQEARATLERYHRQASKP